jgi:hypothetical protein
MKALLAPELCDFLLLGYRFKPQQLSERKGAGPV